jgi:hypothetical protein
MKAKKTKPKSRRKKRPKISAYGLMAAAGLIGCARGAPKDLATNPKYFADFGKPKSQ